MRAFLNNFLQNRVLAVAVGAAVIIGMGAGGAIGAATVTSADIRDETIRAVDVHRNSIGNSELGAESVAGPNLTGTGRTAGTSRTAGSARFGRVQR